MNIDPEQAAEIVATAIKTAIAPLMARVAALEQQQKALDDRLRLDERMRAVERQLAIDPPLGGRSVQ